MERGGKEVLVGPNLPTFTSIQINGGRQLGVIFLVVSIFFIFSFFFSLSRFPRGRTNRAKSLSSTLKVVAFGRAHSLPRPDALQLLENKLIGETLPVAS